MIELRVVETDADLEAWRRVRIAVLPNERTAGAEEIRRTASPDSLFLLAELDGRVAGSGVAGRSDMLGRAFVNPRVLPEVRRRGVGTALLCALAEHAAGSGYDRVGSEVEDADSLAFAERFGFCEIARQVQQVRTIGGDEQAPRVPDGIGLLSLADGHHLFRRTYFEIALQAFEDMPTPGQISISLEDWERSWVTWPEGSFVALAGGEIVGCAGLLRDDDRPDRAENSLTAVRRDWRGRGLARVLKETVIAWAAANGLRELVTWTQDGNENMRAVNERLGYETRTVSIALLARLPLP